MNENKKEKEKKKEKKRKETNRDKTRPGDGERVITPDNGCISCQQVEAAAIFGAMGILKADELT